MEQRGGPRVSREHLYQQLEAEGEHEIVAKLRHAEQHGFPEVHVCMAAKKRLLSERIGFSRKLMLSEPLTRTDRDRYGSLGRSVNTIDQFMKIV